MSFRFFFVLPVLLKVDTAVWQEYVSQPCRQSWQMPLWRARVQRTKVASSSELLGPGLGALLCRTVLCSATTRHSFEGYKAINL